MTEQEKIVRKVFIIAVITCTLLASCNRGKGGASLIDYTATAERKYMLAMDEFYDEDCTSADKLFQQIRKSYPYSRYAVLAELRMADCQFIQDNYSEAAVQYQQFVKAHPTHEDAQWAAYRRGVCFYELIPKDLVITPPPHERDQASTRDAREAFSNFLRNYKDSKWRERARELLDEVENALVRHEMYVARFYLSREDRLAAAVRLEGIRKDYPDSGLVPDAMLLQGVVFLEMNQVDNARRVFEEIIDFFPRHHQSKRAKDYLRHLAHTKRGEKRGSDG